MRSTVLILAGSLALLAADAASAQCGQHKVPSPLGLGARFGTDLDLAADRLIVGAPGVGAAVIYRYDGANWNQDGAPLMGPPGAQFGVAVTIAGDRAVIGMPFYDDGGALDVGAIELWTSSTPGTWTMKSRLPCPILLDNAQFGTSVSMAGDYVIVGAPGPGLGAGRAFSFKITPTDDLTLHQTIASSYPFAGPGDRFGFDVATDGTTLLIGAPSVGNLRGATDFLRYNPVTDFWAVNVVFSSTSNGAEFGHSMAISGDRMVVGSPGYIGGGRVSYFEWTGIQYDTTGIDWADVNNASDPRYGDAVAATETFVMGGIPRERVLDIPLHGALNMESWTPTGDSEFFAKIELPVETGLFGDAVDMEGETLVVGAPGDDLSAPDAGAVFLYTSMLKAYQITSTCCGLSSTVYGKPEIDLLGSFCDNETIFLGLTKARPSAPAFLIVGLGTSLIPFMGGTLAPNPQYVFPLATDGNGEISLVADLPPGLPSNNRLVMQFWIDDPNTPFGLSATSGRAGRIP